MLPADRSNFTKGYTIALISSVIWSTTSILIRYLTLNFQIPALVLAFWRDALVAVFIGLALLIIKPRLLQLPAKLRLYLLLYGLALALFNALWTVSIVLNGAAVATVLSYCSVGFTALLGWWFLKEKMSWAKIVAAVLSLGGCVLVSGALDPQAWLNNLLGIVTGILSGLLFGIYSLLGRSASQQGVNPWTTLFYTFSFASLFLLILNLLPAKIFPGTANTFQDFFWLGNSVKGWLILLLLAGGPTLFGYGLYNVSLNYLPSSVANLIVTSEPIFTAITAYFMFHETFNFIQTIGSLCILGAIVFLRVYEGWLERRTKAREAV